MNLPIVTYQLAMDLPTILHCHPKSCLSILAILNRHCLGAAHGPHTNKDKGEVSFTAVLSTVIPHVSFLNCPLKCINKTNRRL